MTPPVISLDDDLPGSPAALPPVDGAYVARARAIDWRPTYLALGALPYWGVHIAAIAGIAWLGWSWWGFALAWIAYVPRMFFVTGGYHRYFAHRAYKTSRAFQFILAVGAEATFQKGVLWWAAHHRHHHKVSDEPGDIHSVKQSGFWWSHMGWFLSTELQDTDLTKIKDFARYPELRWLNRWWYVPGLTLSVITVLVGGWFALVWAFFLAQVFTWHGTFTINSLSHLFGSRRYDTGDDSRNNWMLGLLTLGEGWHNNHHHYQVSARQGFRWWELDITYLILRGLAVFGIVWDLHGVPAHVVRGERRGERPPERTLA